MVRRPNGIPKADRREIKRELWQKSKLCGICGKQLPSREASTIDHIMPISLGGTDEISNLQLAHSKCNNVKGNTWQQEAHLENK